MARVVDSITAVDVAVIDIRVQPGALPSAGGPILSMGRPLQGNKQEMTEFEFHISPVPSLVTSPDERRHRGVQKRN